MGRFIPDVHRDAEIRNKCCPEKTRDNFAISRWIRNFTVFVRFYPLIVRFILITKFVRAVCLVWNSNSVRFYEIFFILIKEKQKCVQKLCLFFVAKISFSLQFFSNLFLSPKPRKFWCGNLFLSRSERIFFCRRKRNWPFWPNKRNEPTTTIRITTKKTFQKMHLSSLPSHTKKIVRKFFFCQNFNFVTC